MSVAPAQLGAKSQRDTGSAASGWWHEQGVSVCVTHNIDDVAEVWRQLEAGGIESPGQSLDFTRVWIEKFAIASSEQLYVTGSLNGKVVALLALRYVRTTGMKVLTWFAGAHVGCNAPLIDRAVFEEMNAEVRAEFWRKLQRGFTGADMVCLDAIPNFGDDGIFDGLGTSQTVELLYRTEFESWEECDRLQRSRSRRKHDRQQGAKLAAMGEVTFEELTGGLEAVDVIATLFRQKSKRFRDWGVDDPFVDPDVQKFYADMLDRPGTLEARLHVLRLDGEIVAVRYNLVHGDRVFALISSMSENDDLFPGSPGKQNLLRGQMQMFSNGVRMVDMGAGYSDEKRHWCNVTVPVRDHVLALTGRGRIMAKMMGWRKSVQRRIKDDPRLFRAAKTVRALRGKTVRRG